MPVIVGGGGSSLGGGASSLLRFGASSDAGALATLLFLFLSACFFPHERQVLELGAAVFVQPF